MTLVHCEFIFGMSLRSITWFAPCFPQRQCSFDWTAALFIFRFRRRFEEHFINDQLYGIDSEEATKKRAAFYHVGRAVFEAVDHFGDTLTADETVLHVISGMSAFDADNASSPLHQENDQSTSLFGKVCSNPLIFNYPITTTTLQRVGTYSVYTFWRIPNGMTMYFGTYFQRERSRCFPNPTTVFFCSWHPIADKTSILLNFRDISEFQNCRLSLQMKNYCLPAKGRNSKLLIFTKAVKGVVGAESFPHWTKYIKCYEMNPRSGLQKNYEKLPNLVAHLIRTEKSMCCYVYVHYVEYVHLKTFLIRTSHFCVHCEA